MIRVFKSAIALLIVFIIAFSSFGCDKRDVSCLLCGEEDKAWKMEEVPYMKDYFICKKCYDFINGKG